MIATPKTIFGPFLLGASSLALAACGGGSDSTTEVDTTPPAPIEEVVDDVVESTDEVVEDVVADTEAAPETVEDVVAGVEDTVDNVTDDVTESVEGLTETVEDSVDDVVEDAVETATDTVTDTVEAVVEETVSDEIVAAYTALTGDATAGRRAYTKCMSCHSLDEGQNRVGPSLYGIIGRPAGQVEGFRYSSANEDAGVVWTEATMFAYLEDPRDFMPGTIMAFPGIPSEQERADVIAYIKAESE